VNKSLIGVACAGVMSSANAREYDVDLAGRVSGPLHMLLGHPGPVSMPIAQAKGERTRVERGEENEYAGSQMVDCMRKIDVPKGYSW
jgi:hypothetical protein